ncbi:hypothetical protein P3T25_009546 [Paraburkholderia sp. GAS32]
MAVCERQAGRAVAGRMQDLVTDFGQLPRARRHAHPGRLSSLSSGRRLTPDTTRSAPAATRVSLACHGSGRDCRHRKFPTGTFNAGPTCAAASGLGMVARTQKECPGISIRDVPGRNSPRAPVMSHRPRSPVKLKNATNSQTRYYPPHTSKPGLQAAGRPKSPASACAETRALRRPSPGCAFW